MGRTLHYKITKDNGGNFTRKEFEAMFEISTRYNSKEMLKDINEAHNTKLETLWTCEHFWLGIGNYYPNWAKFKEAGVDPSWEYVEERIESYKETMHPIDAILKAKTEGWINFHGKNDYKKTFHSFTKTQGNEFNSLLVFKALIEISKRIPNATLHISDEGEFLLCPLKIKNGLVLPEINELIDDIKHYSMLMMLSPSFKGNILKKLKHTKFQNNDFKNDIRVGNSYGDMSEYIDNKLRNLQEIENALTKVLKKDNDFYLYNIENRDLKDWFKPEFFVRPVDVLEFLSYKRSPATMMDGFHGEGFGLTDKDSEAESYKMLATIFGILEKSGFDKGNIKTLGTDY